MVANNVKIPDQAPAQRLGQNPAHTLQGNMDERQQPASHWLGAQGHCLLNALEIQRKDEGVRLGHYGTISGAAVNSGAVTAPPHTGRPIQSQPPTHL